MSELLLIPLEDSVVFPNMSVTLAVDVGDAERVFLVPVHEGEYASVGTVAEVDRARPAPRRRGAPSPVNGLHRGVAGAARTGPDGRLRVEVDERPDVEPPRVQTAELETRVPRDRRGDPRAARRRPAHPRLRALDHATPARSPTRAAYAPDVELRREGGAARDGRRRRAARARRCGCSASGSPSCRCAGASATTSSPARRSSSASTSCAGRWSRSARSSARTTASAADDYRTQIAEADMPDAVREQAEREVVAARADGRPVGESQMIRTYLDWLLAVPWGKTLRGAARSRARARGARRRPRRARGRQGPHRRVPRRPQAARGARDRATTSARARS